VAKELPLVITLATLKEEQKELGNQILLKYLLTVAKRLVFAPVARKA